MAPLKATGQSRQLGLSMRQKALVGADLDIMADRKIPRSVSVMESNYIPTGRWAEIDLLSVPWPVVGLCDNCARGAGPDFVLQGRPHISAFIRGVRHQKCVEPSGRPL